MQSVQFSMASSVILAEMVHRGRSQQSSVSHNALLSTVNEHAHSKLSFLHHSNHCRLKQVQGPVYVGSDCIQTVARTVDSFGCH